MAQIARGFTFSAGAVIVASQFNTNENTIYNDYNSNIDNTNIASGANIAATKLNLATIAQTMTMSSIPVNFAEGANIASSATPAIGTATGNSVHITGTTTITGFDTIQAGVLRNLIFDGALTFTHNATSLILPTGANITTAAGDTALMMSEGSGNWRCLAYYKKDGSPLVAVTASNSLSGSVIQTVNTQTGTYATGSTTIPYDNTIPQNTEGDQYMTLSITPNNTNNKLLIDIVVVFGTSGIANPTFALFQDSTANALASCVERTVANVVQTVHFRYFMTAGTTSSTTFKLRAGGDSGTFYFNGGNGAGFDGGVLASSITIQEIKA